MQITNRINNEQKLIEIQVSGDISKESTQQIIQHAIVEAYNNDYREMVLDLRKASFNHSASLLRLHSLLQVFKSIILHKELRVYILFNKGDAQLYNNLPANVFSKQSFTQYT